MHMRPLLKFVIFIIATRIFLVENRDAYNVLVKEMNAQITESEKVNAMEQKAQNLLCERERERNSLAMNAKRT